MKPFSAMCLLACSVSMLGQSRPQVLPFRLGETFEQVRARHGRPTESKPGGDIWYRKVAGNEFRVVVGFGSDESVSRLHPLVRVESVSFYPDKRESWSALLGRIAEIRQLCSSGCSTFATSYRTTTGAGISAPEITFAMCPRHLGDEAHWEATRTAKEPCVSIDFAQPAQNPESKTDWASMDVDSVFILGQIPADFDRRRGEGWLVTRTDLGVWQP